MKWHLFPVITPCHHSLQSAFFSYDDAIFIGVGIATKIHHVTHQNSTASSSNIGRKFEIGNFGRNFLNTKIKTSFYILASFFSILYSPNELILIADNILKSKIDDS